MRLTEFQTVQPKQLTPKATKLGPAELSNKMIPKGAQKIGSPSEYGRVFTTKDEPGTATKIVKRADDLKKDAYFQYVSAIAKNDRISKNPYFPRIYNVKVKKDDYGQYIYAVEMERLQEFDTLSKEEVLMLGKRMFFQFDQMARDALARRKEIAPTGAADRMDMSDFGTVAFAVMKGIEKAISHNEQVATYIKDPYLRGALTILKHLVKSNRNVSPDIHTGNIMVRRTPAGPQLVIADPVSG